MVQLRDIFLASFLVGCTGKTLSFSTLTRLQKNKCVFYFFLICCEYLSSEPSTVVGTEGFPFSSRVAPLPSSEGALCSRCSGNLNGAATDANQLTGDPGELFLFFLFFFNSKDSLLLMCRLLFFFLLLPLDTHAHSRAHAHSERSLRDQPVGLVILIPH